MPGDATEVGSIVGYLRMDAEQFHREIELAIAETERLKSQDVEVKVRADSAPVERLTSATRAHSSSLDEASRAARVYGDATDKVTLAQARFDEVENKSNATASQRIAASQALVRAQRAAQDIAQASYSTNLELADSEDRVAVAGRRAASSSDEIDTSHKKARTSTLGLVDAIVALGPALVPIAAGAVGLGVAFGGMGAAGVAALIGIKQQMDAGTTVGRSYAVGLDQAKQGLSSLAAVAAGNVLGSFQQVVADLNSRMPSLSSQIGEMATVTGRTAAALSGGLLTAFVALEPLMRDAGVYVEHLATRFQGLMSSGGVATFADYVRSVFPQVMQQVEEIVGAAIRLVAAFAPLGGGTLTLLGQLATLINGIPVDILAMLATTAASVFVGFRTWSALQPLIAGVGGALSSMGASAEVAAVGVRSLQAAAGVIGVAIAALSFIFTANAEATRQNEQATNDLADALRRSNGAIDDSVRATMAQSLAADGTFAAAKQAGIGLDTMTSAALGNAAAVQQVRDRFEAFQALAGQGVEVSSEQSKAFYQVADALGIQNGRVNEAIQKNQDLKAATQGVSADFTSENFVLQTQAANLGVSTTALTAAQAAQQKHTDAAAAATLQMQVEGNAAGLLKQALDLLNGKP